MKFNFSILFILWSLKSLLHGPEVQSAPAEESSLLLVHVLFRHGNRTPNGPDELYPKDPYRNETYFPVGLGQLTNAGKRREYSIGKALRNRYNNFLGPYYYPTIVEPQSTDYNRTKMSLLLVLAGLFPPRASQMWNRKLNWQPIPYNYLPASRDPILLGVTCPYYLQLYNQYVQSDKMQTKFSKYENIFQYLSRHTGLNITTFSQVYNLYFGLTTEEEWGFKLPDWTDKVWPQKISDLTIKEYFVATATTDMNRMASGYFLQKLINDSNNKISRKSPGRKLYLYSAHESNIAELLILLGVFDPPHIPNYGSYITFEIHKVNGKYGIKIFYENYTDNKPQLLKLPACETFCPFDKFISLIEEYFPPSADFCYQK